MNKKRLSLAVGAALAAASTLSHAAPFNSFDPRSMAMGGAGVAVANTATAPFFNPSMLAAAQEDDDFAMELPIIGMRAYDPDDFIDSVDEFQNDPSIIDQSSSEFRLIGSVDQANISLQAFGNVDPGSPTYVADIKTAAANAAAALGTDVTASGSVAGDTVTLSTGLDGISNRAIQGEIGAGMVIGIPSKTFGGALVANSWNVFGGVINYRDGSTLTGLAGDVSALATALDDVATCADPFACQTAVTAVGDVNGTYIGQDVNGDVQVNFDQNNLQSSVDIQGVSINEVGLSLAREFEVAGSTLAIGITPKVVKVTTFDYRADVSSADSGDVTGDDFILEHSSFNLDLGVAKDFENGWRTGFVVKNLISQEYDTVRKGEADYLGPIELKPQARIGVSHQTGWSTVALDVDLTENNPVSFEDPTRYVALGAELNAFDFMQLRVGYRADMVNSDRSVASAGIGLSPFGIHLDVGVAANENEIGASMQFGVRF